jgi:hypothetical protein
LLGRRTSGRLPRDRALDLDRPAGGDDGCSEDCRDVGRTACEHAGGGDRPRAAGGRGSCSTTRDSASGCPAGSTAEPEQVGDDPKRADGRNEHRKLAADPADLCPELAAADTVVEMSPRQSAWTNAAVVGDDQLLADLSACVLAGIERLREADARPHEQRLDRGDRHAKRFRQVRVGHPAELTHQQCRALVIWQAADVGDQRPQRVTTLDLDHRIAGRRPNQLQDLGAGGSWPPQIVDAAIVRHPVQPRPQCELPVGCPQAGIGADEDVLKSVLRVVARAGQHLPRVGEQSLAIAVVDDAKGVLAASPEQGDQLLV